MRHLSRIIERALRVSGSLVIAIVACGGATRAAVAAPRWLLIYQRQVGNQVNSGALTMETHVFRENGAKGANVGVTNRVWPGTAIFGNTDSNGWRRVTFDDNNCKYDVTIFDPATAKDYSADFYWQNPLAWPYHYSYVTHWLYVSDDTTVTAFPDAPVYHYDLVSRMNHADGFNAGCQPYGWHEAPGANSDAKELASGGWSTYQAQTFVVPAGINRIISVQAWLSRGASDPPFYYWASIHQGGPTGTQIGPRLTSQLHHSVNFKEEAMCWALDGVPVTPGQTYALKLEPTDGAGCNVWRTVADNYSGGSLWNGSTQVAGHDMIAVIVGVNHDDRPATLVCNPTSFTHTIVKGSGLADNVFNVTNGGGGTLSYTVQESVSWLSVSSTGGTSTGEADPITITYATENLTSGSYTGTILVNAPDASPPSQAVIVNLTVDPAPFAPCDFDKDGDVDQEDFGVFQACFSGAGVDQTEPACEGALLDADEDVDAGDFAIFLGCLSGPGVEADPSCAD